MNPWRKLVAARERALVLESGGVKIAGEAQVGLDALVDGAKPGDLASLVRLVEAACADPARFFSSDCAPEFSFREGELSYSTLCHDPLDHPNRSAHALVHHARSRKRAVVLLPFWNAARADLSRFGALLAWSGIGCVQLSLPYHDQRQTPGCGFAREMASENLGLTIQANRQAVVDARAALTWLESSGYERLGVVGMSLGSSIASIVAALDERVKAAAFLLMADDFAEVVWTGSATRHVRESLERTFTLDQVRAAWPIISPHSYARTLAARMEKLLIVSGELDTVFLPRLTRAYVERLREAGLPARWRRFGCGHYTLGMLPYAVRAAYETIAHLKRSL
jgi:alpha/beta hydrolase family protein